MKLALVLALVAFAPLPAHAVSSFACGIAPIPPIGCRVGPCVCDQNGENCQWTFICK